MPKAKVLKVNPASPDKNAIAFAAELLKNGGLVAFPTETVYGIGANFSDKKAIERLYRIKKRPKNKPFTIHIASTGSIKKAGCTLSRFAKELIKKFWPGPLTIITARKPGFRAVQEKGKLAFRMPRNEVAKILIAEARVPVAAPSANISGKTPARKAAEVAKSLGNHVDLILDGGRARIGRESTIVDTTGSGYRIVREGAIPRSKIAHIWEELE